jgi:hypothetical protein
MNITPELIDEWTRNAPAAGLERDLLIAQRAAQLAQSQAGADRGLRWEIVNKLVDWNRTPQMGDDPHSVAAEILSLVANWINKRGGIYSSDILHAEAKRK